MIESALYTLLKTMGIPVAYDHFVETTDVETPAPPFILYRSDDAEQFKADNKVYYKRYEYIVDLVTTLKDTAKETALEKIFDDNEIPWEKAEDYIDTEKIFQIRYFI